MRHPRALALLLGAALAATGLAQDKPDPYPPVRASEDTGDPFVTPPSLRRAGEGVAYASTGALLAALPGLGIRGTIEVKDRPPAAILTLGQVEATPAQPTTNPERATNRFDRSYPSRGFGNLLRRERTVVVRVGDRVGLLRGGQELSVEVLAISQGAVTLRVGGPAGPTVTLR